MKLSVLMPVYNEERTVEIAAGCSTWSSLSPVESALPSSTTTNVARGLRRPGRIRGMTVAPHPVYRGKGAATRPPTIV